MTDATCLPLWRLRHYDGLSASVLVPCKPTVRSLRARLRLIRQQWHLLPADRHKSLSEAQQKPSVQVLPQFAPKPAEAEPSAPRRVHLSALYPGIPGSSPAVLHLRLDNVP